MISNARTGIAAAALFLSACMASPRATTVPDYDLSSVPNLAERSDYEAVVAPLAFMGQENKACLVVGGLSCRETVSVVISSFLIRSAGHTVLLDPAVGADYSAWIAVMPGWQQKFFDGEPVTTLGAELLRFHQDANELDATLVTHAHFDHIIGVTDLPQAKVLIPESEVEYLASIEKDSHKGVLPKAFRLSTVTVEGYKFDGPGVGPFEASHDVFGDGSFIAIPLPGHTPGSMGLLLPNVGGRPVLFIGDLVWNRSGLDMPAQRARLVSRYADVDRDDVWDSIYRVQAFRAQRPDVLIVPAHDELAWRELSELSAPWEYEIKP